MAKFELLKVGTMVATYLIIEGFRIRQRRNKKLKEKMLKEQESRLNEQKR